MKKRIKYILITFLLLFNIGYVNALTVSKNELTIEKGGNEKIELYANVEAEVKKVDFTLVFSTYDIPAEFIVNSAYTDTNPNGVAHSIVLPEATSGKILLGTISISAKQNPTETSGTVNISSASATTSSDESISLNIQNINVKVTEKPVEEPSKPSESSKPSEPSTASNPSTPSEPSPSSKKEEKDNKEKEDKGLLEKIESKIVKINLKKDVFEYTVTVKEDLEELDLKPVAKKEDTKIELSTQKIKELKDNKITITATNGDIKQEYIITVKQKAKNEITIDTGSFEGDTSYKGKFIVISVIVLIALVISALISRKK